MIKLLLVFSALASSAGAFAESKNNPRVSDVKATATVTRENGTALRTTAPKWSFLPVSDTAKAYFARFVVYVPEGKSVTDVTGNGLLLEPQFNKGNRFILSVGTTSATAFVRFADGSEEKWSVKLKLSGTMVTLNGCQELNLAVEADLARPPVFFAGECRAVEDRIVFNASVPSDMLWETVSITETAGQGERWRVFEIPRSSLVSAVEATDVASMEFKFGDRPYTFKLKYGKAHAAPQAVPAPVAKPEPTKPAPVAAVAPAQSTSPETAATDVKATRARRLPRYRVDSGLAQLGSQTRGNTSTDMGVFVAGQILSRDFKWKLRGLLGARYVFPVQDTSAYEFSAGIGRIFWMKGERAPGFGAFLEHNSAGLNQEISSRTANFSHNAMGVVGLVSLKVASNDLLLLGRYSGLTGDSTGLGLDVAYEGFFRTKKRWGGVFHFSSASEKTGTSTSKFVHLGIGGSLTY